MTVNELIQILKTMPQDLPVYDFSYEEVIGCHVIDDFYHGDAANPQNEIITVVMID